MAETGLPGRPSSGTAPKLPKISGLPGRMAICQKSTTRPRRVSDSMTRSWSPTLAPPVVTSRSTPAIWSATPAMASRSSLATGSTTGSPPQARTRAASAWELELTIPPVGIVSPGMAISSPVARIATRGRRCTVIHGWLAAAARPISRAVSRRPAGSTRSPAAKSCPARRMWRPAVTGSPTVMRPPSRVASSWIRMPSAPSGTTLPVNSRTVWPGPTTPENGWPAGAVPITSSWAPSVPSAARSA